MIEWQPIERLEEEKKKGKDFFAVVKSRYFDPFTVRYSSKKDLIFAVTEQIDAVSCDGEYVSMENGFNEKELTHCIILPS